MADKVQSEPPHIVCAQCVGQDIVSHGSRDRGYRERRRRRLVRSDDILVGGCTGAACNDGLGRAEVFSGARCAGTVLQRKLKERLSRQTMRYALSNAQWTCSFDNDSAECAREGRINCILRLGAPTCGYTTPV